MAFFYQIADGFNPSPVDPEVRVPDPGGRAHVDQFFQVIREKLHVIDETENDGGKFGMNIIGLFSDNPAAFHGLESL